MTVTRRDFIAGATAAVASAAAFGFAGCAPRAQQESNSGENLTDTGSINWDEEYDIVVVGAGLAGTSTAVTVATEGDGATCLLLEKGASPQGDGNSIFSSGTIVQNKNPEVMLDYVKKLRGDDPTVSDAILETFVNAQTEHVDWLKSLGATDFHENYFSYDGSYAPEYPELFESDEAWQETIGSILFDGGPNGDGYTHPQAFMADKVVELSDLITFKTNAPAIRLIQDPATKEILGVEYEEKGKSVLAKANKGVVMCLGGYERNNEILSNYLRAFNVHPCAGNSNTGDGIDMVCAVGAKLWHMANVSGFYNNNVSLDGESFVSNAASNPRKQGIIVGKNGRRYYMDNGGFNNKNLPNRDLACHTGYRHGDFNFGGEWIHQQLPPVSWFVFDQVGMDNDATKSLGEDDPVAGGWGYKADTIAELAEQMGVPAEELEKTVAFWSECCDRGEDVAFHRFEKEMNKIETGPFYAMKMMPYFLNTEGGPERNENAQILGLDGNPIPKLYASGEFGSIRANMYQAGDRLSECIAFGRIAARHALGIA